MAIRKSFGGASINKPGAYSRSKVDNSGGAPLAANTVLFLVGEAIKGAPGSSEGIQEFNASQLDQLVAKYGSGPIVDCALAAVSPSPTQGIGGAGKIMVWKTNASTQASLDVNEATDTNRLLILKDRSWGAEGNKISVTIANGTVPARQKSITINKLNETSESLGENPGTAVLSVEYTGDATTATLAISGASKAALALSTTLAGDQTDGSVNLSITLKDYSMKELVDYINSQTGYSASLSDGTKAAKRGNELDSLAATDITSALSLYRLQQEIVELINDNSDYITAELDSTPRAGLPVNVTNDFLTGGAKGASANSDFSTGMSKSLAKDYNVMLTCVSRDAADDIADSLTDASSSYTISSIHAAQDAHLALRGSIKNRKEAQGMGGLRNSSKSTAFSSISGLGSYLMQVAMQDVMVLDETATLSWKQPHVLAAIAAGIRLGTEVGEPLTHKFARVAAVGHAVDPDTGIEAGDFDPSTDVEDAIDNGVLFLEKAAGGWRFVVDNTTYGQDQSFVFNRGSVVEASQYVAKTLRETAELVFVGKKVSNGLASSIKSVLRSKLLELNRNNIITASSDAPNGFVEDSFVVTISGNTAEVQVHVKPVQGLDFVLITFTLGDISQSA